MVYIVLLNWNGWRDTIECLESLYHMDCQNFKVIVCDNQSSDDSLQHIEEWAAGNQACSCESKDQRIQRCVIPFVSKPISIVRISEDVISQGNVLMEKERLVLVENHRNLGFAGGCNVGIRLALQQPNCQYIWLLNNDTVADQHALTALLHKAEKNSKGIYGSKLVEYYNPDQVQAYGTVLNRYLGTTKAITEAGVSFDYLVGASMFIPATVFREKGLLSEDYFLYYEEPDFWQRCKDQYKFLSATDSIVYHKEGASTGGNNRNKGSKSLISDYYSIRNRILFMKRYYPTHLPFVYLGLMVTIVNRIRRHQFSRISMIIKLMLGIKNINIECSTKVIDCSHKNSKK